MRDFAFTPPFDMNGQHILIVDDDEVVAKLLQAHLENAGYSVTHLADGAGLVGAVSLLQPDAILLDASLPSADGFELCRELRPSYSGAILLLTARDDDVDELLGLELGADDYLRKPVNVRLVLAHLRACLRRGEAVATGKAETLVLGDLTVCNQSRRVTRAGADISLTTAEFDLLWALASRAGSIVSRDDLFRSTRGLEHDGLDRSIDMRISRLRKLLGDDPQNPQLIKTVRGQGYLLAAA
ncbi:MAG: winged helix-turn-helix domain-containing protein [Burkholderiales bacterium]|jgi:DNA-binding response OmpR family regulator